MFISDLAYTYVHPRFVVKMALASSTPVFAAFPNCVSFCRVDLDIHGVSDWQLFRIDSLESDMKTINSYMEEKVGMFF